jgi:hypothetical protein
MLVRSAAPAGATGTVFGFVYSGLDLGSAVTPPFLGLLLDHHLPRLIFVFTAGILLLATRPPSWSATKYGSAIWSLVASGS